MTEEAGPVYDVVLTPGWHGCDAGMPEGPDVFFGCYEVFCVQRVEDFGVCAGIEGFGVVKF